eukprot:8882951-Lingulodinium_polyedra.AAC.1
MRGASRCGGDVTMSRMHFRAHLGDLFGNAFATVLCCCGGSRFAICAFHARATVSRRACEVRETQVVNRR